MYNFYVTFLVCKHENTVVEKKGNNEIKTETYNSSLFIFPQNYFPNEISTND